MSKNFDVYIESGRENLAHLAKSTEIAKLIKKLIQKSHPKAKIYLFGSTINGKYTASSDIDILIISNEITQKRKYNIITEIRRKIGFNIPIEIHICTEKQFKSWYSTHIKNTKKSN